MKIAIYDRNWLDANDYELTDRLFQEFNLLNEDEWAKFEIVGVCLEEGEPVGVIGGYDGVCVICQVLESHRRKGIGTQLVKASGQFYPKQNGAPEFWEAIANN